MIMIFTFPVGLIVFLLVADSEGKNIAAAPPFNNGNAFGGPPPTAMHNGEMFCCGQRVCYCPNCGAGIDVYNCACSSPHGIRCTRCGESNTAG